MPERENEPREETPWERRKRLAAIFGEVLPDTTRDERSEPDGGEDDDEWLRRQVPPHHG